MRHGSAPLVGAIDIGTNSVLLLIASSDGETLVPVVERATITRLGEGVDRTRRLDPAAVERTLQCLSKYADELRAHGVARVDVVGTSAMRDAEGGSAFVDAAERLLQVRPRTIAGLEEAALTFAGSLSGLALRGPVSVFDVGGGSTEIIHGDARTPAPGAAVSLDVGSVRLFERHVRSDPATGSELAQVVTDITRALESAPRAPAPNAPLVGVAGTVTTLAAIELGLTDYDPKRVHGHTQSLATVCEIADRLASMNLAQRRALTGLEPKRADVIVVGAEIVRQVMLWAGASELRVSDRGVRWGLAERLIQGAWAT